MVALRRASPSPAASVTAFWANKFVGEADFGSRCDELDFDKAWYDRGLVNRARLDALLLRVSTESLEGQD